MAQSGCIQQARWQFLGETNLTIEIDRETILKSMAMFTGGGWTIGDDLCITVVGDVGVKRGKVLPGPGLPVVFDTVYGSFDLGNQHNLKNLEGCPRKVVVDFGVIAPNLESLEGGPQEVGGYYRVRSNSLTSLVGLPTNKPPIQTRLSITPHVGLLSLLDYHGKILWGYPTEFGGISNKRLVAAVRIISEWQGKGADRAIECAAELANADCKENARW